MFLSGKKLLNNFPIFTHARITHLSIKAFSQDRVYLLFLDQTVAFHKQQTSQDVGRYRDTPIITAYDNFLEGKQLDS